MNEQQPTIALVHGAFAESASWNGVIEPLLARSLDVVAFAPDHGESAFSLSTMFPGSTLGEALAAYPVSTGGNEPAWKSIPAWFVVGGDDRNIPAELQRFEAKRAESRVTREVLDGSHAVAVSQPDVVAASIFDAVTAVSG